MATEKEISATQHELATHGEEKVVEVKMVQGSEALAAALAKEPTQPWASTSITLYFCCLIAFFCSTMNGYDGSLMGALLVMPAYQNDFNADYIGLKAAYISAMYQIGGVVALPFVGPCVDTWGRRVGMFIGCTIIVLGTAVQSTSVLNYSLPQFLAGRFFLGFGISIAASAGPAYVVEIAHPLYRGTLTGLYNCFWFTGSILAAGVTRGSLNFADTNSNQWVVPTAFQAFFSGIILAVCLFLPESPRWLCVNGREEEARAILTKYHGHGNPDSVYVSLQMKEFLETNDSNGADKRFWDYSALFRNRASIIRISCNVVISIFGQWAGNGVVSYFLGALLSTAGITDPVKVLDINLGLAFVSCFFAIVGAFQVDRLGRRPLLLFTNISLTLIWVAITVSSGVYFNTQNTNAAKAIVGFVFMFGMFYSVGFTPLQALYPVEVLSFEQRAKGMAFSSLAVNAAGLLNQFAWPVALEKIGWKTYIIFVVWCAFQTFVIYFFIPETKGRTLEELDEIFEARNPRNASIAKKKIELDASRNVINVEDV